MLANKLSIALIGFACLVPVVSAQEAVVDQVLPESAVLASQRVVHFDQLHAKAHKNGSVPVIIQFDTFDTPLPNLSTDAQGQRLAHISDRATLVLEELAGQGKIHNIKRFRYSPHLALTVDEHALSGLEHNPNILDVVEDSVAEASLGQTTALLQLDTAAWSMGDTGAGLSVAILDTGVDYTHPFLAGKVVAEACYSTTYSAYGATSLCPGGNNSTSPGSGINCSGISVIAGSNDGRNIRCPQIVDIVFHAGIAAIALTVIAPPA